MGEQGPHSDKADRVEKIASRFHDLLKAGAAPVREAVVAAYPDLAPELSERLVEVERDIGPTGVEPLAKPAASEATGDARGETFEIPTTPADLRVRLTPDLRDPTAPVPDSEKLEQVGPYRILDPIGRGGMGAVYLAQQTEPVRRRVALKLIKLGMDTEEVIARFESERQALALMDHPNIAHVLDAGSTEQGRPYFVMEHVRGEAITDYCDRQRLTIRERLELFQQVCDGVQHAHHKGIIHRDLKPSNILVTIPSDRPVVKIIDFGIAKATNQTLTEHTFFTQQGRIIGTPEYMSPEQAEAASIDVDTRTDIYSLGVVLYRLLTGALPFASEELRSKGYDEIRRVIREGEPPRPSTKLSSLGDSLTKIAAHRATDTATLGRAIRGELDWIVMCAMEKDRSRRYSTAAEFAADIARYLKNEPILARPPSAAYLIRKAIARNRGLVVGSTVVFLTLVAGMIATLIQADRASEQARLAEERGREVEKERQVQVDLKEAEIVARKEAERERRLAEENARLAQRESYLANIHSASASLRTHQVAEARRRLERCPDELRGWEWRHLSVRSDSSQAVISLPGQRITTVAVSDSRIAAGGSSSLSGSPGRIWLWDSTTGKFLHHIYGHEGRVLSVAFSPDGSLLASGEEGLPDEYRGTVRIWEASTGKAIRTLAGHDGAVTSVAFGPAGRLLASASLDSTVRLWDVATGAHAATFEGATSDDSSSLPRPVRGYFWPSPRSVEFSPDGRYVAWGGFPGSGPREDESPRPRWNWRTRGLRIWDISSAEPEVIFAREEAYPCLAFGTEGKRLAIPVDEGVELIDFKSGKSLRVLKGSTGGITTILFGADGTRLLASSEDKGIWMWDSRSGALLQQIQGHSRPIASIAATPDLWRLVSCTHSDSDTIRIWDPTAGGSTRRFTLQHPSRQARSRAVGTGSIAIGPDGKRLAAVAFKLLRLWELPSGTPSRELRVPPGLNFEDWGWRPGVSFIDGGERVLAGGPQFLGIWSAESGELLKYLTGDGWVEYRDDAASAKAAGAASFTVSPDGKQLISGRDRVGLRDLESGKILVTDYADGIGPRKGADFWRPEGGFDVCYAFSPGGLRVVSGTWEGAIRLRDAATLKLLTSVQAHATLTSLLPVTAVGFSPDGRKLVSGARDGLKVWDAKTLQQLVDLRGHEGTVEAIAMGAKGDRIFSASTDGSLRVWDPDSDEALLVLRLSDVTEDRRQAVALSVAVHSRTGVLASLAGDSVFVWHSRRRPLLDWPPPTSSETNDRVLRLRDDLLLLEEVEGSLREDDSLSNADRERSLELARLLGENVSRIGSRSILAFSPRNVGRQERLESLRAAQTISRLVPDSAIYRSTVPAAHLRLGEYERCLASLETLTAEGGETPLSSGLRALASLELGREEEARRALDTMNELLGTPEFDWMVPRGIALPFEPFFDEVRTRLESE